MQKFNPPPHIGTRNASAFINHVKPKNVATGVGVPIYSSGISISALNKESKTVGPNPNSSVHWNESEHNSQYEPQIK